METVIALYSLGIFKVKLDTPYKFGSGTEKDSLVNNLQMKSKAYTDC